MAFENPVGRWLGSLAAGCAIALLSGCGSSSAPTGSAASSASVPAPTPAPTPPAPITAVSSRTVAAFAAPWAMAFLPDGRLLVTERPPTGSIINPIEPNRINPTEAGRLRLVTPDGIVSSPLSGLPANVGLLGIVLDPAFASNRTVYISFMERDPAGPRIGRNAADTKVDPVGLAVMRVVLSPTATEVVAASVIWRQVPKVVSHPGSGQPGGSIAFSPDGRYLFVAAGDRQEFEPTQSLANTLGKIVRILPDGTIPADNPFVSVAGALPEIWTLGHRNPYGLAFNAAGQLWQHEMGPDGGDEFNLIAAAGNYGWPVVSYGNHYDGGLIRKPAPGDGFVLSALSWTPSVAPSSLIFYSGSLFADWRGDAILVGLQSRGLVRVRIVAAAATEMQRISLGERIRAVAQGPDGAIWVLEDYPSGRLLKLTPSA